MDNMCLFCSPLTRITSWRWTTDGCELKEDRGNEAVCACSVTGFFAVTTDMYNDNVSFLLVGLFNNIVNIRT